MGSLVVIGGLAFGGYTIESSVSLSIGALIPILILMVCFIVQSSVEEIVFRGWMLNRIAAKHGFWAGAIGNSLVFALLHIDDSVASMSMVDASIFVSMTMLFSIFLSLMVRRDRSVWGACAWHASWNWLFITWWGLPTTGIELGLQPLLVDLMPVEGAPKWLSGGAMGPEDTVFAVAVLVLGTLYYLMTKDNPKAE
ncbi:MAG: lysostaphin resistance A-like protein, partial [Kordiimonas sp.]